MQQSVLCRGEDLLGIEILQVVEDCVVGGYGLLIDVQRSLSHLYVLNELLDKGQVLLGTLCNLCCLGNKTLLLVGNLHNGMGRLRWVKGDAAELRVSGDRHGERGDSANECQTAGCGELLHVWKLLKRRVDAMVRVGGDEDVFADVDPRSRTFLERDDR